MYAAARVQLVYFRTSCKLQAKYRRGEAMRMSDEEYFRSCVAKERLLAQLLGHHNI